MLASIHNVRSNFNDYGNEDHYDKHKNIVIQDGGKTASSIHSIVLPEALIATLVKSARSTGYVIGGCTPDQPMNYSTQKRTFHQAIECLGFKGICTIYDLRTTYATELCEAGLTSKQVADKTGDKDTRMVDRIYARTRHESVMVNAEVLDKLNKSMIL